MILTKRQSEHGVGIITHNIYRVSIKSLQGAYLPIISRSVLKNWKTQKQVLGPR